ncbi:photosynthesis system II assembly factor Ycf48 [Anthocerotibacter panamensis]|uniref:photosynthesis system II assembly factor Ycf48 n=1 Tax=Anthocerotibacter panamensis TaxID=2857077 RepID=UPI001FD930B6|nr:photosynthesis system II assembly factor Ycf48 [Anthocerotibacter panamensis]
MRVSGYWVSLFGLVALLQGCATLLKTADKVPWLPSSITANVADVDLLDVTFVSPQTGWLVGSKTTVLKTEDGGKTWQTAFAQRLKGPTDAEGKQEDLKARFLSVDFSKDGQEGWIVGKPRIVLHTEDGGKSWFAIPLNKRIDGNPLLITVLGKGVAELAMDTGFVFKTEDGGKVWRALTPSSAGGLRNIYRTEDGSYWAVSARGSTYLTWTPGQPEWTNHERRSPKRIQNLVFVDQGSRGIMLNNGGEMQISEDRGKTWGNPNTPDIASAAGLLDSAEDQSGRLWITGGNGTLLVSPDEGKTWERAFVDTKSNLYRVEFMDKNLGFILGRGIILRYQAS